MYIESIKRKFPTIYKFLWNVYFNAFLKVNPLISTRYLYLGNGNFLNISSFSKQKIQPNLMIIGAQKSGTTSLYNHLGLHPNIFMSSPIKEPGYFMNFEFIKNFLKKETNIKVNSRNDILKSLMLQGYKGQLYFGDASTYYTIGDFSRKFHIPELIKETNPNMKFLYIIRNPIGRIVSRYLWEHIGRSTDTTFNNFLAKNKDYLVTTSSYFFQLTEYLKYFPKTNFKLIIFEEYIKETNRCLNDVFDFLSVERIINKSNYSNYLKSYNRNSFPEKELLYTEENYEMIINKILQDIANLENLLGRSLDIWDVSKEKWCYVS